MRSLRPALIVYEGLPVSAGGAHHIRDPRPSRVWQQLRGFFELYADALEFRYLTLAVLDDFESNLESIVESAVARFGVSERRGLVSGVVDVDLLEWSLSPDCVTDAIAWVEGLEPVSASTLGPAVGVEFELTFLLKDPATGARLPFQEPEHYGHQPFAGAPLGTSWMHSRLSSRSTCSVDLCLPFTDLDDEARLYVERMATFLPFKLSSRYWTRMQLNRAGAHYYPRKVSGP